MRRCVPAFDNKAGYLALTLFIIHFSRGFDVDQEMARPAALRLLQLPLGEPLAQRYREDRMLVRDLMSMPAITIRSNADYKTALALMQEKSLHHLPVVNSDGEMSGMAAERDLLIAATRFLQSPVEVGDVMHRGVVAVTPDTTAAKAARLLVGQRIGSLPVVDGAGKVIGIVTETDILKAFAQMA